MTARPVLADQLDLQPRPEGGWFRETWRSPVTCRPDGYRGQRNAVGEVWQAAAPAGTAPVLVSCVVAAGFDFADFRVAQEPVLP